MRGRPSGADDPHQGFIVGIRIRVDHNQDRNWPDHPDGVPPLFPIFEPIRHNDVQGIVPDRLGEVESHPVLLRDSAVPSLDPIRNALATKLLILWLSQKEERTKFATLYVQIRQYSRGSKDRLKNSADRFTSDSAFCSTIAPAYGRCLGWLMSPQI